MGRQAEIPATDRILTMQARERASSEPLQAVESQPLLGGPSFSRRHRLLRVAWNVTWWMLAAWTPPLLHGWRRFLLRLFGAHIAPTAEVYASSRVWYPPNLTMAEYSCLGPEVKCYCIAPIALAPYALASQGAFLCTGSHDIADENFQLIAQPITIGARAWIAAEAFVGPGVHVGEGAVLGARACTFHDLAPWTVYVGNPARPLKPRIIEKS